MRGGVEWFDERARNFPVRNKNDVKIIIGPGDNINGTPTTTSHTPRGETPRQTPSVLNHTQQSRRTRVRWWSHLKEDAFRRTIAFAHSGEGFTCTANESLARENGVGGIAFNSSFDDVPVMVVTYEQISSSCLVAKR